MTTSCVVFTIGSGRYAIAAADVAEITRAVAITPLPGAPPAVAGIIDVRGDIIPVFDLRMKFGAASRPVAIEDHFIVTRTQKRMAALHVDTIVDIIETDIETIATGASDLPAVANVAGVAATPDGLVLIHDVDTFLSDTETALLDAALDTATSKQA